MEKSKGSERRMQLRKIVIALLALLLAGAVMVPCVSAAETKLSSNMVSIDEASNVALINVQDIANSAQDFSEWNDSEVMLANTYFDLSGNPTAYAFNVMKNGEYNGYILVSAQRDNYPVLECSRGYLPAASMENIISSKTKISESQTKDLVIQDPVPVYLGATFYLMAYPLTDKTGNVIDHAYVDLTNNRIINSSELKNGMTDAKGNVLANAAKKTEIERLWSLQNSPAARLSASSVTRSSGYIYGVPYYAWYRGCSPTAAAMVLGYWQSHGYPNYPTATMLIDELGNAMGTSCTWPFTGATFPLLIDDGIETVAANHGYSGLDSVENIWYDDDHFTDMAAEIDAGRPFVLSMYAGNTALGKPDNYNHHSVTVVGYVGSIQKYLTIHDTWNTPPNYPLNEYRLLANGNWEGSMSDWVRP
jgi:hypothetical protein